MSHVKVFETAVDDLEEVINKWAQSSDVQITGVSVAAYVKRSSAGPRDASIEVGIPMAVAVIHYE